MKVPPLHCLRDNGAVEENTWWWQNDRERGQLLYSGVFLVTHRKLKIRI
jgi:hypothetical protein